MKRQQIIEALGKVASVRLTDSDLTKLGLMLRAMSESDLVAYAAYCGVL